MAFDSIGNLFAAETLEPDNHDIGRALRFNLRNHVSTVGSAAKFFFEGLAVDIAGNAYVMATDDNSPTAAGTIFKFTPDGERIVFGSVPRTGDNEPQQGWGLAFDSAGNLYAARRWTHKRSSNSLRMGRAPFSSDQAPSSEGEYPVGLRSIATAIFSFPLTPYRSGNNSIVYFTPTGV